MSLEKSTAYERALARSREEVKRKRELERRRDIAQRAVSVTDYLCIHGFLPDLQTRMMAARVMKYMVKYGLGLVDKGFKDYLVLLPKARVHKKWRVILAPWTEAADEQAGIPSSRKARAGSGRKQRAATSTRRTRQR